MHDAASCARTDSLQSVRTTVNLYCTSSLTAKPDGKAWRLRTYCTCKQLARRTLQCGKCFVPPHPAPPRSTYVPTPPHLAPFHPTPPTLHRSIIAVLQGPTVLYVRKADAQADAEAYCIYKAEAQADAEAST